MTINDLMKFCAVGRGGLYDMSRPWAIGQHWYATDSRILIRIPAPGEPDTQGNFPRAHPFPWDETMEWLPLIHARELDVTTECPECERPCPECGQSGWIQDSGVCMTCDTCRGSGIVVLPNCHMCHGDGNMPYVAYGDAILHPRYHHMIASLPRAEWARWGGMDISGIAFRFDGGQGFCMGVVINRSADRSK